MMFSGVLYFSSSGSRAFPCSMMRAYLSIQSPYMLNSSIISCCTWSIVCIFSTYLVYSCESSRSCLFGVYHLHHCLPGSLQAVPVDIPRIIAMGMPVCREPGAGIVLQFDDVNAGSPLVLIHRQVVVGDIPAALLGE